MAKKKGGAEGPPSPPGTAPAPPPTKKAAFKKVAVKKTTLAVRRAPAAPARAPRAAGEEEKATFAEFFQTVGKGLVDAQSEMDRASRRYLSEVRDKPYLLPSVFRIPKLTAQMKFSLSKEKDKGFNLLFLSKNSGEETRNEQSVEFEIVSAPPPSASQPPPFAYEPVLAPARRTQIFETLAKLPDTGDLTAAPQEVLILANLSGGQYLLLRAGTNPGQLGLWYLIDDPDTPLLAVLRAFGGPDTNGIGEVRNIVNGEGKALADFLKGLG